MALLQRWQEIAYNEKMDQGELQRFWQRYFLLEKGVYEQLLTNPDEAVEGTVKELAEKYKENNSKWMSQENIFCFFALLISVVSMLLVLANKYFKNDLWTSDLVQFILYFSSFLVFKLVECKGWVYKDKRFNKFLEILNRNAPVLIILSTTIFYGLSLTLYIHELKLTYFAMLIFALVPLGAIVKTVVQMSPT